jgi:hypothetical protein
MHSPSTCCWVMVSPQCLLLLLLQTYVYLSSIAVKDGKVFALFVRSPSRVRSLVLRPYLQRAVHALHVHCAVAIVMASLIRP